MITYEAVPHGDRWVGQFQVNDGKVRLCGHRHHNAKAAEQCAGTIARRVAREEK